MHVTGKSCKAFFQKKVKINQVILSTLKTKRRNQWKNSNKSRLPLDQTPYSYTERT